MATATRDHIVTLGAMGLLAYASADIAHHVAGHGGACLALGGHIISISSIFVNCTVRGAAVDLAGPLANLVLGVAALFAARRHRGHSPAPRLFWILTAAFNLFWLEMQLVFSAATRTDDWAWAMHVLRVSPLTRDALMAGGAIGYVLTVGVIARLMAPFAQPRGRVWTIVLTAWFAGGLLACVTGAFDHAAISAILHHAIPQSFALSIGLLFVPRRAASFAAPTGAAWISRSPAWMAAAALAVAASVLLLGPGFGV